MRQNQIQNQRKPTDEPRGMHQRAVRPRSTAREAVEPRLGESALGMHGAAEARSGRKGRKRAAVAIVVAAAVALAGLGAWQLLKPSSIEDVVGGPFYDQSATEIQEAVDHEVEDGYFNMSVNTSVPVSGTTALIGIKNIDDNKFDCAVTVTLEDGTQVYKSGGLAPGTELKTVELDQALPSGDYAATALFEIYERDDSHAKAGQTASKLTLHVE